MKKLLILPALLLFSGHSVLAQEPTILDTDNIEFQDPQTENTETLDTNNIEFQDPQTEIAETTEKNDMQEEVESSDPRNDRPGMNFEEDDSRDRYEKNSYDDEDMRRNHHERNNHEEYGDEEEGDEDELIMVGVGSAAGGLLLGGLIMWLIGRKKSEK